MKALSIEDFEHPLWIHMALQCVVALALLFASSCTDQDVTEDFGKVIECDDKNGAWVDHGWRMETRVEFDPVCMPKCLHQRPDGTPGAVCPDGLVFYTVPVKVTSDYPAGNLCYCDDELGSEGIGDAD